MDKRDYYEVLGVDRGVDEDALKKSYRRLAMKFHPDRNPTTPKAEEHFKEAKEAYEVLSDPQKRAAYDQFGARRRQRRRLRRGRVSAAVSGTFSPTSSGHLRGRSGGARAYRGADLRYPLELDLERAVAGDAVTIRVPTVVGCETCAGSGARPGTQPVSCETCGGNGQVRMQQGFFSLQQTCPRCKGAGTVSAIPAERAEVPARSGIRKTLSVKIPRGWTTATASGSREKGRAAPGRGRTGSLRRDRVRDHPIFQRHGRDLACEVPISFATATLAARSGPHLDGAVKLRVPDGTQTGGHFRLRGKGVRSVRGGAVGDLRCRVVVETPVRLTSRQKEILGEFDAALKGGDESAHAPRATSWFNGVKRFFEDMRS